jgi:hypothetical protein
MRTCRFSGTILRCTGYLLEFGAEVLHELFPVDWNAGLFSLAANLPVVIRHAISRWP